MGVTSQFRVVTAKLGLCPPLLDSIISLLPPLVLAFSTNMWGTLVNPHSLGVFYRVWSSVGHHLFAQF